ncbi:MAG: AmmeMemoRadiSam system protein A [Burkholderiales bacterium]
MRTETAALLPPQDAGKVLLPLARAAIARKFGETHPVSADAPWLHAPGACFVTLTESGKLRGCIGTLRPHRPLLADVTANAVAAAFRDPRFKPLTASEFESVELELSLLSPLENLVFSDERDALVRLRPGIDGVVFEYGRHSSTFLPQVWEDLREPAEFMAHLKYKAGLPPDFWDHEVKLMRYTVAKWRESGL